MCINQNLLQIPSHTCIGYYPIGLCRRFPYAEQIAETEGGGGCIHFLHFAHACACTQEHTNGVMSSMSPTPLPFLHSCFPLFPTQHAAIPGDPASCCWSGPLQHTHLHYCTHCLHLSARTYELPVNQAAAQCRPHCLSVVGVRSWMSVFV